MTKNDEIVAILTFYGIRYKLNLFTGFNLFIGFRKEGALAGVPSFFIVNYLILPRWKTIILSIVFVAFFTRLHAL